MELDPDTRGIVEFASHHLMLRKVDQPKRES